MPEIFCDSDIKRLIVDGKITHVDSLDLMPSVQPSSLDVVLPMVGYEVDERFNTHGKVVSQLIKENGYKQIDLSNGAVLQKGKKYLFRCMEIELPSEVYAESNPKSSIGRLDILLRTIYDGNSLYNRTPKGYNGDLWIEIMSQSFNVRVYAGLPMTQLNILNPHGTQVDLSLDSSFEKLLGDAELFDQNTILLGLSVPKTGLFGYKAKSTDKIIDLSLVNQIDPEEFFEEIIINGEHDEFLLESGNFYVVASSTKIYIPPEYSAEMLPLSHYVGELRLHYAGFFDPGFGWCRDESSLSGNTCVFHIRPYENYPVVNNQPVALLRYLKNSATPKVLYGFAGNNYANQKGVRLAKYFKMEG